ncbi:tetratricopeptide repeat protein [Streptomyces sp. NPDC057199]|uniref:tetratricopeptide repeat protein n=1 Tax=Streptomyces sp. NPDC057199 TaxID=3346047 RepID=UPI003631187B
MEPRRLADIRAGDALSTRSVGSGYLVAPQLVLTALHTVTDAGTDTAHPRIDVRIGHPRRSSPVWRDGEVCWTGPADTDVALVWLDEAVPLPGIEPVRWGRPTGGRALQYEGLGYPLLAEYADDERGVETLRGVLPPLSTGPAGMFVLDQAAAPRPRPRGTGERAWSGVSGAAVFCHGFLVGVVVRDDAEYDNRRLHACPVHAFMTDTALGSLLSRHGEGPPRVEDIPDAAADSGDLVPTARLLWPTSVDGPADESVRAAVGMIGDLWPGPAGYAGSTAGPDARAPQPAAQFDRRVSAHRPVRLPPPPTAFVGRDSEVRDLLEFLDPHERSGPSTATALVTGMVGIGKTALALHVAHEARQRGWFRGGVCFLNAQGYGPNRAAEAGDLVGRLLRVFGFGDVPGDPEHVQALWHELLARLGADRMPVLVVVDDVSAAGQVAALLPGESRHRVVITTRDALTDLDARLVPLSVLPSRHSVALIDECLRIARPDDRRFAERNQDTVRLTELCGGLPLALRTMASLLRPEPALSPGDLADELADTRMRLDALSPDGIDVPVRAAFDLSYRRLTGDQARAFRSMAVHPGPHLVSATMAALMDCAVPMARRALRSLSRVHLVESAAIPGAPDAWTMHSLLRIYAQEQAARHPEESSAAQDRLLDFYRLRARAVQRSMAGITPVPAEDDFATSTEAMSWLNTELANVVPVGLHSLSLGRGDVAFTIVLELFEFIAHHELGEELLPLTEKVMEWAQEESDTATKVNALVIHANALIGVGRPQEVVAPLRSALGITRSEPDLEGVVRLALGLVYRSAGRLKESAAQCRAAVSLFEETDEAEQLSAALTALGNALRLLDLPEEAAAAHRRAAEVTRATGGSTYRQAVSLNNLGNALWDMDKEEESCASFRQAMDLARECGAVHLEITISANLAGELRHMGRHEEGARRWSEIAELCHRMGDSEREFKALGEAGRDLQELDDFSSMLDVSRRAVACSGAIEDQTHAADVMNNLAVCLARTGDVAGAVAAHVRAALHFRTYSDPDQPEAVNTQIGLALKAARAMTDHGQAAAVLLEAAALIGEAQLPDWEGQLRSSAGSRLADAERYEESVTALTAAAAILEGTGDLTRQGYALNNLGISLRALSRYEESTEAIRQDLAICRAAGDREGEATSLLNLAQTLVESGDTESATAHRRAALEILVAIEADPETIDEVRREIAEAENPPSGGTGATAASR